MKKVVLLVALSWLLAATASPAANGPAPLPADFPVMTTHIYDANAIAPGYVFLAVALNVEGVGHYLMILENDGTPVWYRKVGEDEIYNFGVMPNGLLHYAPFLAAHSYAGGGDVLHTLLDEDFNIVEEVHPGNGYVAEGHTFLLLPNGHVLLTGYYMSPVDMSKIVPGASPNALVSGGVVQELDAQRNVVFQWRTWDHYGFEDFFRPIATDARAKDAAINTFHLNGLWLDDDGHIIISTPQPAAKLPSSGWVRKINRQTGAVMWTLGGSENQFTFVGVTPAEGIESFTGHGFYRLENGNVLIYDNGDTAGKRPSRVYEYKLDEANKVATYVWSYTPDKNIAGTGRGNAQRLLNGNTMIGWGTPRAGTAIPGATEVTRDGKKVWELSFADPTLNSYRAYRFVFPSQVQAVEDREFELATGNTYDFGETGVSLTVRSGGGGYNEVAVTREPYGPVYPEFPGKAPRVLALRIKMAPVAIVNMTADIRFDVERVGLRDPDHLTVYYRPFTGHGLFVPLPTMYNPVTKQLKATMSGFGEFIFGYPDLADVALPPTLNEPENYRGVQEVEVIAPLLAKADTQYAVNQALPISLSWSPTGLARGYELQIARTQDFAAAVVDLPNQTDACYVWNDALPDTTYYYRVRTYNDGGISDWSAGSFRTVPPMVEVTVPNGGEVWKKGLTYFVQWKDNLSEDVVIELYKGTSLVETIGTVRSDRAYKWEVDLNLTPGHDYSIRIKSATDGTIADQSDAAFSIE
jgi:hypothetical protein